MPKEVGSVTTRADRLKREVLEAHAKTIGETLALIERLRAKAQADLNLAKEGIHWGHVGDWHQVNSLLRRALGDSE